MGLLWHRVARWVTTCFYRLNHDILLAEAALQPLTLTIRSLQVAYVARVGGTFPPLNPASARLPPGFPSPWADRSFTLVNHIEGVVGIRRTLPWRTARSYNEPCIRLSMDELAHRFLPLINTLSLVEPDRPCLPPYKRHFPPHMDLLSHYTVASWVTLQQANTHLSWGLQVARDAPHYPYPVPSRPHRFMQLGKFQASRIHQMRSGRSYLAAQEDLLDQEPNPTCRKCGEGEETFHHTAITCPAHAQNRAALCPTVNSVMYDSHSGGPSRTSKPSDVLFLSRVLIFLLDLFSYVIFSYFGYPPLRGKVFLLSSHGGLGTSLFPNRLCFG